MRLKQIIGPPGNCKRDDLYTKYAINCVYSKIYLPFANNLFDLSAFHKGPPGLRGPPGERGVDGFKGDRVSCTKQIEHSNKKHVFQERHKTASRSCIINIIFT